MVLAGKGLNLSALRRVRGLWKEELQPVTLAELWGNSHGTPDEARCLQLARQTQRQIKVRLAQRLQDFLFLPYKAMADPAVRTLYSKYVSAYTIHEEFDDLRRPEDVAKYWISLAEIFEENQNVTTLLGMARKRLIRLDTGLAPSFDHFVSDFLVSRIGTHLLGSAFFQQVPTPAGGKKPAGVAMGVLQPTSPASLLVALVESFKGQHPEQPVPVDIQGNTETTILYIPGHLRGILREVLHNAMRETASHAEVSGVPPAPVKVRINHGRLGVFVVISDEAGGISDMSKVWRWGEDPEIVMQDAEDSEDEWEDPQALMAKAQVAKATMRLPLGFGLPLARLTARYFGGDLRMQTLLGHGTNAYIHIPELQHDGHSIGGALQESRVPKGCAPGVSKYRRIGGAGPL
ncbi:unnamed protein product [Durusdinium trenchii]|uniref:Protein-serine/threonine kinase n=2 Tax=Durusdinium trenchii TaxID=1381693 RepID=A0ABP0N5N3_9DINO